MARIIYAVLAVVLCVSPAFGGVYSRNRDPFRRSSRLSASAGSSASASVQSGGDPRGQLGSARADSSSSARVSSNGGRGQASANSQSSASATLSSRNDIEYCSHNECYSGQPDCSCYEIGYCYFCEIDYDYVPLRRANRLPFRRQRDRNNFFDRPQRFPRRLRYEW